MAALYDLSIDFTQGGNSTSEVWSLENKVWTSMLFTRSALTDEVNQLFDYIKPLLRPDIIIKGATMSLAVPKGQKKGKERNVLTFAGGIAGTRVVPNNFVPTELALGLRFEKDSETPGMAGHWLIRGTLLQTEVKIGKDGFYVLADNFDYTAVRAFETNMTNDPDAAFRLVLPAKGSGNFITASRNIHEWKCVGLGRKDLRNNRKSLNKKQDDAAKADVGKLVRDMLDSIGDGFQLRDILDSMGYQVRILQLISKYGAPIVGRIILKIAGSVKYAELAAVVTELPALAAVVL